MATTHYEVGFSRTGQLQQDDAAADVGVFHLDPTRPATVTVNNATNGTSVIEYTTGDKAAILAATAKWVSWSVGNLGASASGGTALPQGATAVRVSPSTALATVSVRQASA